MFFQEVMNSVYNFPGLLCIIAGVKHLARCALKIGILCFSFEHCCLLAYDPK